jgi:hypothetical protein
MKTADRENPNSRAWLRNEPSRWGGRSETSSLHSLGLERKKVSGGGRSVLLDFTFYRTYQDLARHRSRLE